MNSDNLPAALVADWDWQRHAACRRADPAVFFAPDHEHRTHRERRVAAAKAICATCPVQQSCLDRAQTLAESYGIWGGLTDTERHRLSIRSHHQDGTARLNTEATRAGRL